jgi:hypothetical protein
MCQEFEEKRGGDLIRQIGNTDIKIRNINFQDVSLDDLELVLFLTK